MSRLERTAAIPPMPDLLPPAPENGPSPNPALPLPSPGPIIIPPLRSVRAGSWLLNYTPSGAALVSYDGTWRVESHSGGRTASGDLYQRPVIFLPIPLPSPLAITPKKPGISQGLSLKPILPSGPNPAAGIPILARSRYRYYLRVTALPEYFNFGISFSQGFQLYRFSAPTSWALESTLTAQASPSRTRTTGEPGWPS